MWRPCLCARYFVLPDEHTTWGVVVRSIGAQLCRIVAAVRSRVRRNLWMITLLVSPTDHPERDGVVGIDFSSCDSDSREASLSICKLLREQQALLRSSTVAAPVDNCDDDGIGGAGSDASSRWRDVVVALTCVRAAALPCPLAFAAGMPMSPSVALSSRAGGRDCAVAVTPYVALQRLSLAHLSSTLRAVCSPPDGAALAALRDELVLSASVLRVLSSVPTCRSQALYALACFGACVADLGDRAVLPPYVHHSPFGHTQPAVPVLGRGLVMDGTPCYSEPCAVAVAQPLVYVLLRVATLLHELLSVHASVEVAYSATVAARAVFNGGDVRRLIAAGPDGSRAPEKLCGYRRDCGRGEGTIQCRASGVFTLTVFHHRGLYYWLARQSD